MTGKLRGHRFQHSRLGAAVALACLLSQTAGAADLGAGDVVTVRPGDALEEWFLEDGAVLNIAPGGQTEKIFGNNGAVLNIDGGTVNSTGQAAISLVNSTANIHSAAIHSSGSIGLSLSNVFSDPLLSTVTDSTISGATSGVEIESTYLDVRNSSITGGAVGIYMADGKLNLEQGTQVVGDQGLVLTGPMFYGEELGNEVRIDGSSVTGRDGSAIYVEGDNWGEQTRAQITVSNGSTLQGSNGVILEVADGAQVDFTVANSALVGDVVAHEGASTQVRLTDNAVLTGQLTHVDGLTLANGGRWNMVDDARLGTLAMDQGVVDMGGGNGAFRELQLQSLSGNGLFVMGADLATGIGDRLTVTDNATGSFGLALTNTGLEPAAEALAQAMVQTGGGDADFAVVGGQVEAGAYAYELEQQGDDWYLVQKHDARGRGVLSGSSRSVLGLYNAAPNAWYGELTALRGRLDELKTSGGGTGLWLRSHNSKAYFTPDSTLDYQQRQGGFALGADASLNDELRVGLMAGYSQSDLDFNAGTRANIDSFHLGVYSSWMADSGYYVDALIKANRFRNKADVRMSDGRKASGHYSNLGLGTSIEGGKRMALGDGWSAKSFAQLSALAIQGKGYQLDNGLQADSNNAHSMLGKVGVQVGRHIETVGGGALQPYLRLAQGREFADTNQVRINNQRFDNSLAGSRTEYGVGVAAQVSDGFELNADFEYVNGSKVEQPYGLNLGVRYAF